jgi:hypothetical protein
MTIRPIPDEATPPLGFFKAIKPAFGLRPSAAFQPLDHPLHPHAA